LKEIRQEIAKFSLKNAALRVEAAKLKKLTVDPLDEEDEIDR
jgi:hypothetical protein